MTTNIDLEKLAKKNKIPLDYVVFKNELVKLPKDKQLYIIINMSDVGHPGTHWVSLYYSPSLCVYFDPFGVEPPNEVIKFCENSKLDRMSKTFLYSDYQIEDIDGTNCGQLSLKFLDIVSKAQKTN